MILNLTLSGWISSWQFQTLREWLVGLGLYIGLVNLGRASHRERIGHGDHLGVVYDGGVRVDIYSTRLMIEDNHNAGFDRYRYVDKNTPGTPGTPWPTLLARNTLLCKAAAGSASNGTVSNVKGLSGRGLSLQIYYS